MTTVFAGILMLGVLVFIHELGHFAIAKLCDVKVLKFSLGFGPKLISKQWGETEYLICAIPLGGYVQMLGEGSGEHGELADVSAEDKDRSFAEKPVSKRLAIVSAGPLMNLLLPFLILPISFMVGVQMPSYIEQSPCVGYVVAESNAAENGFLAGDCIVSINHTPVATWNDANRSFVNVAGEPLRFEVERGGKRFHLDIPADNKSLEGMQALGLLPTQEARVGSLAENMPAKTAGIQEGDLILQIADRPINSWYDLRTIIQEVGAQATPVTL